MSPLRLNGPCSSIADICRRYEQDTLFKRRETNPGAVLEIGNLEEPLLLLATASSFTSRRLARLAAPQPERSCLAANTLLTVLVRLRDTGGRFGTVAHRLLFSCQEIIQEIAWEQALTCRKSGLFTRGELLT